MFAPARTSFTPARTSFAPASTSFAPARTSFAPARSSFSPARTSFAPARTSFDPARTSFAPSRQLCSSAWPNARPRHTAVRPRNTAVRPRHTAVYTRHTACGLCVNCERVDKPMCTMCSDIAVQHTVWNQSMYLYIIHWFKGLDAALIGNIFHNLVKILSLLGELCLYFCISYYHLDRYMKHCNILLLYALFLNVKKYFVNYSESKLFWYS